MADIGLTRAQTGTVFGVFGFMIMFACPISGAAIARWGIRRTMIAGHLCGAIGFWLTSQAESFTDCIIKCSSYFIHCKIIFYNYNLSMTS